MAELSRAEVGTMLDALETLPDYPLSEQGALALLHSAQEYHIPLSGTAMGKLSASLSHLAPDGWEFSVEQYGRGHRTTFKMKGAEIAKDGD